MYSAKYNLIFAALILVWCIFISCQKNSEESAVSADGVSIHYRVQGVGEPVLLFVHGWSCDKSYWNAQVPHFAQQYQVVTIDLAGHGESGLDREEWTIEAFGRDVQAVVEKLDLDPIILIGHSMGGPVIVEAARYMPERVIGLIGVDTFRNIEQEPTQEEMDTFLAPLRTDFVEGTKHFVREYLFAPKSDSSLVEWIVNDMAAAPPEVGIPLLEELWTHDLRPAFQEVQVPICCINSDMLPVDIEAGRRHAHSFEVKFMSGVGHFLMMEDPKKFNQLLEETIADLVSRQAEEGKR